MTNPTNPYAEFDGVVFAIEVDSTKSPQLGFAVHVPEGVDSARAGAFLLGILATTLGGMRAEFAAQIGTTVADMAAAAKDLDREQTLRAVGVVSGPIGPQ